MEEIRVGAQGRVVIPATFRQELGIEAGAVLVGRVEGDRLVLERRDAILRRLQGRFADAVPRGVSLADELVAERHETALREADGA